jgi:lipopolysaccharide/colanic/teichoic acid biosynthesis glycosyltransferase
MNNSELSIMTSQEDTFTPHQAYVYPPPRSNFPDDCPQGNKPFRDECCDDQAVGVECLEATAIHNGRGAQPVELPPRSRAERPDRGLWLLYRSADRHDEWERLRRIPPGGAKARYLSLQNASSVIKRSSDVIGALLVLVILSPLFIVIAIAITIDSPGPVFFRHYRVGKDGKVFVLWKFRSMRTDVPKYEMSPRSVVDVRLTRIGRLIRRLSIDEMPQLINVLRGEMSLVGPRPEMPFIVARYHPAECERLSAKPGITGLWQISPARAFPIHENLQYDLHYIRNQNFLLDCAIILRTITAVIRGVGAV